MEICTVSGYEEVGKNMTALKIGDDVFLFDMGFYLPGIIELQEETNQEYSLSRLRSVGGIPDDRVLDEKGWTGKVRALFLSHAHLDHIAAVPFLINRYPNAIIYGTPFTIKVLESLAADDGIKISNKIITIKANSTHKIDGANKDISVEFIHSTHSTIDCVFIALHSNEGTFFYTLDFKFDDTPTMGAPPNYSRLKEIGENGVKVAVIDTLYSDKVEPHKSEAYADKIVEAALKKANIKDSALFITTFSSHIERLTNIVKHAEKTGREIIFVGRSLAKYVECATRINKCPFRNKIKITKYRGQVNSILKKVEKNRGRYLIVCTGHQGEKNSILERISRGTTGFKFRPNDQLIYSSSIIPTEVNIEARRQLDAKFASIGVVMQKDVHVHGHGSQNNKKKLIELLKPEIVLPAHGTVEQEEDLIDVAVEMGYERDKNTFISKNGNFLKI